VEGVPALKAAGSCDSEDSLGESLTILGLVAKAELSPLDCRSNPPLCNIVGGFYSLMGEEGKQVRPVLERALGARAYLGIRAGEVLLTIPFHPRSHESGGGKQLVSGDVAFLERMPATEDPPHLLEHVL